jgi:hypothetical protein
MHQVLVQIPVGIFLLQSYPLLRSEFPSVLAARSPHRYSENRKREGAYDVPAHGMHAAGRDRSETTAVLRKVDVCGRYDSLCSGSKIRNARWHFIWFQDAYFRFAAGRTAESAISKAINFALHQVKERFNAAELDSINVREYPGFQGAEVTLYARQIQQGASLGLVDDMTIRQLPAR